MSIVSDSGCLRELERIGIEPGERVRIEHPSGLRIVGTLRPSDEKWVVIEVPTDNGGKHKVMVEAALAKGMVRA